MSLASSFTFPFVKNWWIRKDSHLHSLIDIATDLQSADFSSYQLIQTEELLVKNAFVWSARRNSNSRKTTLEEWCLIHSATGRWCDHSGMIRELACYEHAVINQFNYSHLNERLYYTKLLKEENQLLNI